MSEEVKETKEKQLGIVNILKILLILVFLPLYLSYWIWKKDWDQKAKIGFISSIWLLILVGIVGNNSYKKGYQTGEEAALKALPVSTSVPRPTKTPTLTPTLTPISTSTPTPTPTPTSIPSPTPTFDTRIGNNSMAAKYAQKYFVDVVNEGETALKANVPVEFYLELFPEDIGDKDEESYKKDVYSVYLKVKIDSSLWKGLDDDSKKNFIVAWLKIITGLFPKASQRIYVNNEIRPVAEGFWDGEPKVILK